MGWFGRLSFLLGIGAVAIGLMLLGYPGSNQSGDVVAAKALFILLPVCGLAMVAAGYLRGRGSPLATTLPLALGGFGLASVALAFELNREQAGGLPVLILVVVLVALALVASPLLDRRPPKPRQAQMVQLSTGGEFDRAAAEVIYKWKEEKGRLLADYTLLRTRKGTLVLEQPKSVLQNPMAPVVVEREFVEWSPAEACRHFVERGMTAVAQNLFPFEYSQLPTGAIDRER